jgi:hypothetical protein
MQALRTAAQAILFCKTGTDGAARVQHLPGVAEKPLSESRKGCFRTLLPESVNLFHL